MVKITWFKYLYIMHYGPFSVGMCWEIDKILSLLRVSESQVDCILEVSCGELL